MTARDVHQVTAVLRALLIGLAFGSGGAGGWWLWAAVIALIGPAAREIAGNAREQTWHASMEALSRITRQEQER